MSRDRYRSRGGMGGGGGMGGMGGMSLYRRGNGGRGMGGGGGGGGMSNYHRSPGYMDSNRNTSGFQQHKPAQQQQPPQQPQKPAQQNQSQPQSQTQPQSQPQNQTKPPQQQPAAQQQPTPAQEQKPAVQEPAKPAPAPQTPAAKPAPQTPAQSPQTKPTPSPQQKPAVTPQQSPQQQQNQQQQGSAQKPAVQNQAQKVQPKMMPPPSQPPAQQQAREQQPREQQQAREQPPPQHQQHQQQHHQQQQQRRSGPNNQIGQKRPHQSRFHSHPPPHEQHDVNMDHASHEEPFTEGVKATLSLLKRPGEKTYTQRCRLFVGNLPTDISDDEFKKLFSKYGDAGEVFINKSKGFGFIKLETRALAEIAKAELDDFPMRGRQLRVRFATHSAALSIRNLSPFVSNELLEEAFSQFGPVERAVVIVDDRGRSTGKGIVEFAAKPAARKAYERCNDGVFLLTTTPMPVIVEPLEQFDDEDGLPEKLAQKNHLYQKEREVPPRFAQHGSFEFEYSQRWKSLDEMEKQQRQQVEKNMKEAREKLESEMDDAYHEHQANLLRQDLMRRQEELRRMEEMHNQEMQKRKEMQLRQEEERRRREEELILRQREMEEQMRRQREEGYRMSYMDPRERDMRMGTNSLSMGDPYAAAAAPKYPTIGSTGMGYEGSPGVTQAAIASSLMANDMRNDRFVQGNAGTPSAQASRGIGSVPPTASAGGYGRGREEYEGPPKKPRF